MNSTKLDSTIEEQTREIHTLGERIQVVTDILEELLIEIQHALRNATTVAQCRPPRCSDEVPESIACMFCDADSPGSLAKAIQEGWIDLCRDDGLGWNYLGTCPQCQEQELADELALAAQQQIAASDQQKQLFEG
jgi:hypothetical protein